MTTTPLDGVGYPRLPTRDQALADPLLAPIRAARALDILDPHVVEFVWPCDRRVAHKPHPIPVEVRDLADPEPRFVDGPPCPGVGAHPGTMIGRAS